MIFYNKKVPYFREEAAFIFTKSNNKIAKIDENDFNLCLIGGINEEKVMDDMWLFDTQIMAWKEVDLKGNIRL